MVESDDENIDTEETHFEPEEELGDAAAALAKIKKLRDELAKVKTERQEYLDGWQRCKADSVNLKKEAEARASRVAELLREELIHDIIPALDSLDMASESEAWASVSDGFRSAMEHLPTQLAGQFWRHGIERIGRVGEALNHAIHEVVEERVDLAGEPETVLRVLRYGYRSSERVLRPAQIVLKSLRTK